VGAVAFWKYVLLAAIALLWVGRAQAATVAILQPAADSAELGEALFRLKGELLAVGLEVAIVQRPPGADTRSPEARDWFEQTASLRGFVAFIDVVGGHTLTAVDVWIWERAARRVKVSRVLLEPSVTNAPATAAIRAIEVLRSSFIVLDLPQSERRVERPTQEAEPPPPRRRSPEREPRFGVAAGAAALTSLDGVGPSVLPLARFEWLVHSWFALQGTAAGFGTRPRVASDAGSADVEQRFAVLGLCACRSGSRLLPVLSLGAGLMHTALEGRAAPTNVGHRVDQLALLVDASAGVRLSLPEPYYLALTLHAQLAEPYVAVHVVDEVVATAGQPNLLLSLTLGAWL
jgi:hypothetical protein